MVATGAGGAFTATVPKHAPARRGPQRHGHRSTGDTSSSCRGRGAAASYHNTNPVVGISGPTTVVVGTSVSLTSTLSESTKNKTYTYAWSVTEPSNASFTLPATAITDEPSLAFVPPAPGTYVADLLVSDNLGGSSTASLTLVALVPGPGITIKGAPGAPVSPGATASLTSAVAEPTGATPVSLRLVRDHEERPAGRAAAGHPHERQDLQFRAGRRRRVPGHPDRGR